MNGRSRLDRYQNLRSNTSEVETDIDSKNVNQGSQPGFSKENNQGFRSGYSRQTNRNRLYQTSEYDSLLKEHEDFLKSLDEQFDTFGPSSISPLETLEQQTQSASQSQYKQQYSHSAQQQFSADFDSRQHLQGPQSQTLQQQYSQPASAITEQPSQFSQEPYRQQMTQQSYRQQTYTQPLQQQYSQPASTVTEQPSQFVHEPYRQQMTQQSYSQQTYTQPVQQQYSQPMQRTNPDQPHQYAQDPFASQMPQQNYSQQSFSQSVQQQYTQPMQRVTSDQSQQYTQQSMYPQQQRQQSYNENFQQYNQPAGYHQQPEYGQLPKERVQVDQSGVQRTRVGSLSELQKPKADTEKAPVTKDTIVFGPINIEPTDNRHKKEISKRFAGTDEIDNLSSEEYLELEPFEAIDNAAIQRKDIFVVDEKDGYTGDTVLDIDNMDITEDDVIDDLDLLEKDFISVEDEDIIEAFEKEPLIGSDEKEAVEFIDDYQIEAEDIYTDENESPIDEIADNQDPQYIDANVFKFIDDILVDVKNDAEMIHTQQPKQDYFDVEEEKTVEDITKVLSEWNLDELEFVDAESIMPTFDEDGIEVAQDVVYQATNPVHTPVYYDDPVVVDELTQKLENERALRQQMLEQTKQIKLQVKEYENELESVNSSMSKTNKILNFVLTLLIMTLFVILFVIGFWFAQERGLI
jgi:hypothetical protein